MTNQKLKHILSKLYDSTKKKFVVNMRQATSDSYVQILHLNLDVYTSNVSKDKYIGD